MFRFTAYAVLLSAVIFSVPALAWDETGHKITAYIAWQEMTPEVRASVIRILLAAPEDAQLSTFYMPYGSRTEEARKREFFLVAAVWPDIIKDKNFDVRYKKYNNSNWHYFDTLWGYKDGKVFFLPPGNEGGHLMEKLADFDKIIRGDASAQDKAIAIAWLEHLIGDLHQPLHTTGRVLGDNDTKGDQGGNLFSLTPKGTSRDKLNLHSFWDSVIRQTTPNTTDACEADYMDPIAVSIMQEFPYSQMQGRIASGKFAVWEKESVDIATTEVYKDVKRYEMPSDKYKKKATRIAHERLALGGYRLGQLFNDVFGTPPPVAAPGPPVKN